MKQDILDKARVIADTVQEKGEPYQATFQRFWEMAGITGNSPYVIHCIRLARKLLIVRGINVE